MDRFINQRLMETTNGGNNEDIFVLCCECGEEIEEREANKNSGYCEACYKQVMKEYENIEITVEKEEE